MEHGEPLAACASLLEQAPRGRLRYFDRATVLLGFPHVQYAMLPWQDGLFSQADWRGFARATVSQQTGLDPLAWQVQVAEAGFGQARLAVASPLELLGDLPRPVQSQGVVAGRLLAVADPHAGALSAATAR